MIRPTRPSPSLTGTTMKTIPLLSAFCACSLALPSVVRAGDPLPTFERLETLSGKVYEQARIVRIELDAAIVHHAVGVARLLATDLHDETRQTIPFDFEGAAKAEAARQAAYEASVREAELDRLYPACSILVQQVLVHGVLGEVTVWTGPEILSFDHAFVELDARALGLVDGDRIEGIRLERLDDPFVYYDAHGDRATVPRWSPRDDTDLVELQAPSSPHFHGPYVGGQLAMDRLFGRDASSSRQSECPDER